ENHLGRELASRRGFSPVDRRDPSDLPTLDSALPGNGEVDRADAAWRNGLAKLLGDSPARRLPRLAALGGCGFRERLAQDARDFPQRRSEPRPLAPNQGDGPPRFG